MTRRCALSIPDSAGRCGRLVATTEAPCAGYGLFERPVIVIGTGTMQQSGGSISYVAAVTEVSGGKGGPRGPVGATGQLPGEASAGSYGLERRDCPSAASLLWVRTDSSSASSG